MSYKDVQEMCYIILQSDITKRLEMNYGERVQFNKRFHNILKNPRKNVRATEAFLRKLIEDFNIVKRETDEYVEEPKKRMKKGNSSQYV
jgi:siroheme synthase (precorrin-2 oxidase/ferrochelatase)